MTNFNCPSCGSNMVGDTGQVVTCARCGQAVAVPKGGMSTGAIIALVVGGLLMMGCLCGIISLAAITTVGSKANLTFQTVGSSLTSSGTGSGR